MHHQITGRDETVLAALLKPPVDEQEAVSRGPQMTDAPANVEEFNKIAALIFAQLYRAFPVSVDIDMGGIAKAMDVQGDVRHFKLASGRNFQEILIYTIEWLSREGYTRPAGLTLTEKGLSAMNRVPSGLKQSVGTALVQQGSSNLGGIGDLIGGIFGGITKSLSSGG